MTMVRIRPHHILDILVLYGRDLPFKGNLSYTHDQPRVAKQLLSDIDQEVELVLGPDDICRPCNHLQPDGLCDDIIPQADPPLSKQLYSDDLDRRLFSYFDIAPSAIKTVREVYEIANSKMPDIADFCTHPGQEHEAILNGLERGLSLLGIRDGENS